MGCGEAIGITGRHTGKLLVSAHPYYNCFVVAGVRRDISVQEVFRGAAPFFIADALTIAALLAFPALEAGATYAGYA